MTLRAAASGALFFELPSRREFPSGTSSSGVLRPLFSGDFFQEWNQILREPDPTMMGEGFLGLASRLEARGSIASAAQVYTALLASDLPRAISQRARLRLEVLQGQGPLGAVTESMARRFVDQALDPTMIAAFGMGSWVAGISRLSVASSLMARGPALLTRGTGLRFASGFAAYAAEVPTFVAVRRSLASFHENPETESPSVGAELRSAALFMGVMQVTGFLGGTAARRLGNDNFSRNFLPSTVGVGGVYLAHRCEEILGLRPAQSEAQRWLGTADTWLQMRVGARLMQGLGGTPHGAVSTERLLVLGASQVRAERPVSSTGVLSFADAARSPAIASSFLSRAHSEYAHNFASDPHIQSLQAVWGERGVNNTLRAVKVLGEEIGELPQLVELLKGTTVTDPTRLEISLRRLQRMVAHSRPMGARGNYVEWLARLGVVAAVRQGNGARLDRIMNMVYDGADLATFETLLVPLLMQYRFKSESPSRLSRVIGNLQAIPRRIRALPMGTPAKDTLLHFYSHIRLLPPDDPFRVDMNQFMEALELVLRGDEGIVPDIERALAPVPTSPLAYLRVFRLYRVLARQSQVYPKFLELQGEGIRLMPYGSHLKLPGSAQAVDLTQFNAFYDEPVMAEQFADFYRNLPRLLDSNAKRLRAEHRRSVLSELWPTPRPLTPQDLMTAFERLGDPISLQVADSMRGGEVELEILEAAAFEAELAKYVSPKWRGHLNGMMIPAGRKGGKARMFLRQIENVSSEVFQDFVFHRLGFAVHEHEHFMHVDPEVSRINLEIIRQEMRAAHREFHWQALQGNLDWTHNFLTENTGGWALHLRSHVEDAYFDYTDPND